ncbi:MAG: hypothetical protein JW869_07905 [Candidatus Omnitrophica bacterium]|nr:hypothetical protein [Candidatus Omnitrophota bacterium]
MKTEIKNNKGCNKVLNIEVEPQEVSQAYDFVYADLRKSARIPGYRPGHAPRDLLETYYAKTAQEEMVKRAISQYYLKAVQEKDIDPVSAPEIENVQFKNNTLCFSAKVDVRPQPKIKSYKDIRIVKKKKEVGQLQVDEVLQNIRQAKAKEVEVSGEQKKEKVLPELNDSLAKEMGLASLDDLKQKIKQNLEDNAEAESKSDMERQLLDQLLKKTSMETPESLVNRESQEILKQIKTNYVLHGKKSEEIESKNKELEEQARKEAIRRVNLSFILDEIAKRENIEVEEEDLQKRIIQISMRAGKSADEVRSYLERNNLISSIKAEILNFKTVELLLKEANIVG